MVIKRVAAPGGAMAVRLGNGTELSVAYGKEDLRVDRAASPTTRFRIWSISKTMTAGVLLQLVDEGRLTLDDPLETWHPEFPNSDRVTVLHLLSHTSGLADYFTTQYARGRWSQGWAKHEMLSFASQLSPLFEPGAKWSYSNTNTILIGSIVERVTGSSLAVELRRRVFEPLGMKNSFSWGEEQIPGGFARGYEERRGEFEDVTDLVHPSVVWATGGIVSTAEDVRRWCYGLFEGKVLSQGLRQRLRSRARLNNGSLTNWGIGVAITSTKWGPLLGHGGGPLHGNTGTMAYLPSKGIVVVTLVNGSGCKALSVVGAGGWEALLRDDP